jgi:hypothetical protein
MARGEVPAMRYGFLRQMWLSVFGFLTLILCAQPGVHSGIAGDSHLESSVEVSPVHPRIWLTKELVAKLKARARNGDPRWLALRKKADSLLVNPEPQNKYGRGVTGVAILALTYQVTGDVKYAKAAINAVMGALPVLLPSADGFHEWSGWGMEISVGFDWCYDQLSAQQRAAIAKWLMDQADAVRKETNGGKVYFGSEQGANNYHWHHQYAWLAALAVYNDEPRAVTHLKLAMTRYQNIAVPFFRGFGSGGVFAEGTSYDSADHVGEILTAHLTATGTNPAALEKFTTETLFWRIHSTCPGGAFANLYGDQTRANTAPIWDRDRIRALAMLPLVTDSQAKACTRWWLDHAIKTKQPTLNRYLAQEFIFYDPNIPAKDYRHSLATAFKAPGTGLCCQRTSWRDDAIYFTVWSGSIPPNPGGAHQDKDANGFTIWKNGWLVGHPKFWGTNYSLARSNGPEPTGSTNNCNNITLAGHSQLQAASGGKLIQWLDTPDHTIFVGQAAGVYVDPKTKQPLCKDYLRQLVFLNPNIFVIHDRIKLPSPSTIEWRLQSKNQPAINGQSFSWDNGQAKLFGQTLAPNGVTTQAIPVKAGPKGAISSYRLEVITRPGTAADFLTVLEVASMEQSTPTSIKPIPRGVEIAGRRVVFSQTDDSVFVEKR